MQDSTTPESYLFAYFQADHSFSGDVFLVRKLALFEKAVIARGMQGFYSHSIQLHVIYIATFI